MQSCTILWTIVKKKNDHNNKTVLFFKNSLLLPATRPHTHTGQSGKPAQTQPNKPNGVLGISCHICLNLATVIVTTFLALR